jgi:hypothetical protein
MFKKQQFERWIKGYCRSSCLWQLLDDNLFKLFNKNRLQSPVFFIVLWELFGNCLVLFTIDFQYFI